MVQELSARAAKFLQAHEGGVFGDIAITADLSSFDIQLERIQHFLAVSTTHGLTLLQAMKVARVSLQELHVEISITTQGIVRFFEYVARQAFSHSPNDAVVSERRLDIDWAVQDHRCFIVIH